jgi:hypothetical protein
LLNIARHLQVLLQFGLALEFLAAGLRRGRFSGRTRLVLRGSTMILRYLIALCAAVCAQRSKQPSLLPRIYRK